MGRRKREWIVPPSGPCLNLGPSMSESVGDAEKAGTPIGPYVELRPKGPPLEITESGPLPLPPEPPPFDRAVALAGLQAAFALLTDEELEVARLRMLGVRYIDISEELRLVEDEVRRVWKRARRKLGKAFFGAE